MDNKEIYNNLINLEEEIDNCNEDLKGLYQKRIELMNSCNHYIVFKYRDNRPSKLRIDGNYYCPICGKIIELFNKDDIKKSIFKDSRVIPLPHLSLISNNETLSTIRENVISNMDFYYNLENNTKDLSNKMEQALEKYKYTATPRRPASAY